MKYSLGLLLLTGCLTPRAAEPAYPRAMILPQPDDQVSF